MFLIPIGTTQKFRRLPVVTLLLILAMIMVFVSTENSRKETKLELNQLAQSIHGLIVEDLSDKKDFEKLSWVEQRAIYSKKWEEAKKGTLKFENEILQNKYDDLYDQLTEISKNRPHFKYRFDPKNPSLFTAISSAFLHGGWMHLIGNLWFLFLFGALVEDFLGRINYIIFFILGCLGAAYIHGALSDIPVIGASGVIAAFMSAFLVFFYNKEIKYFFLILLIYRVFTKKFLLKAWIALPIWFSNELFQHWLFQGRDGVAHSGHIGGFVVGAIVTLLIRFTPLYNYLSEKYFITSSSENPSSYIDDMQELVAEGKYRKALDIAQKALMVLPDYLPLYEMKINIYRSINDKASLKTVYKQIFPVLLKNDVNMAEYFLSAYSDFGDEILSKDLMIHYLFDLNSDHNYESSSTFGEHFLTLVTRKERILYSNILSTVIVSYMGMKQYDKALVKVYEGMLLNSKDASQLTKFKEQRQEIFNRKFISLSHMHRQQLIKLDDLRLAKNKEQFKRAMEKMAEIKGISFTFEILLFYTELLDPPKELKKLGNIFRHISVEFGEHPLLYVVYFRMSKVMLKVKKDKEAAFRYMNKALHLCHHSEHKELINKEVEKLRESLG